MKKALQLVSKSDLSIEKVEEEEKKKEYLRKLN